MAQKTIYLQGTAEVIVPASQSIAISNFGGGIAKIYYLIDSVEFPAAWQLQQTLEDGSVTIGAFSTETMVKIEAGNSKVFYDVGSSPDTGIGDADTLNGKASDATDAADTIALRDGTGDIQANAFESTVATGTAPFTVDSTTKVDNLNADMIDGDESSDLVHIAGAETITGEKTHSDNIILENNVNLYGKDNGAVNRVISRVNSSNVLEFGNTSTSTNIRSNGILRYNGTTLASGTIDTTAVQTITVVDGLITSIS
jgi:hypothetical protein